MKSDKGTKPQAVLVVVTVESQVALKSRHLERLNCACRRDGGSCPAEDLDSCE
jgi:hypothetical protein